MTSSRFAPLLFALLTACNRTPRHEPAPAKAAASTEKSPAPVASSTSDYHFVGGYPNEATRLRAEDDTSVARAVELYARVLPTLAMHAARLECERVGGEANRAGVLLGGGARQRLFAPSLDVPSALLTIDLEVGPVVLELPAGTVTALVSDQYGQTVLEHAATAPGGGATKYLFARAGDAARVPPGHRAVTVRSRRALVLLRALPVSDNVADADARLRAVRLHPASAGSDESEMRWVTPGPKASDFTLARWEKSLDYWQRLHEVLSAELVPSRVTAAEAELQGELARIGVHLGEPFAPSEQGKTLLTQAARIASDRLRVQAFADHSPDALVWSDRQWEWLTPNAAPHSPADALVLDRVAQEKWAFQAAFLSPAAVRRGAGAPSYDWFTTTDKNGTFLDGSNTYRLVVPLPVPAKSFWSITLHDPTTRAELATKHKRATLRSFAELIDLGDGDSTEIYLGPTPPPGQDRRWVQTVADEGFVVHFRLHQPASDTLESTWQLGDLEAI